MQNNTNDHIIKMVAMAMHDSAPSKISVIFNKTSEKQVDFPAGKDRNLRNVYPSIDGEYILSKEDEVVYNAKTLQPLTAEPVKISTFDKVIQNGEEAEIISIYLGPYIEGKKNGKGYLLITELSLESHNVLKEDEDGRLFDKDDDSISFRTLLEYTGEFKDNLQNGKGTERLEHNTIVYSGQFRNGKKHGTGEYQEKFGDKYEGEFKDNQINGTGKLETSDGFGRLKKKIILEGHFENKQLNGYGKMTVLNGNTYEGQWKNNRQNGDIVRTSPGKHQYREHYVNGTVVSTTLITNEEPKSNNKSTSIAPSK